MTHYIVSSPFMKGGCSYRDGPTEDYACVVSVDAPNMRAAKVAAVKHPDMHAWVTEARGDNINPFNGLEAWKAACPHGVCTCDLCPDAWCDTCESERGPKDIEP